MRRELADASVQLTVTSPPYDNLRKYNGFAWDFEAAARELFRVTKPGGVVIWIVADATINGNETGTSFNQALFFKGCGFNLYDTMIWKKCPPPRPLEPRYHQQFEYMFVFSKGKPSVVNILREPTRKSGQIEKNRSFRDRRSGTVNKESSPVLPTKKRGNVWDIPVGFGSSTSDKDAFKHPAIFPERLAADHILTWSALGDLIFDPFSGSGTTGKMALLNGREFIGCDISPEYVELARQRIENALVTA